MNERTATGTEVYMATCLVVKQHWTGNQIWVTMEITRDITMPSLASCNRMVDGMALQKRGHGNAYPTFVPQQTRNSFREGDQDMTYLQSPFLPSHHVRGKSGDLTNALASYPRYRTSFVPLISPSPCPQPLSQQPVIDSYNKYCVSGLKAFFTLYVCRTITVANNSHSQEHVIESKTAKANCRFNLPPNDEAQTTTSNQNSTNSVPKTGARSKIKQMDKIAS
ncbi:hypothetical protein VTK56DRAFT_7061 [Thermocarpiscus australiensis]